MKKLIGFQARMTGRTMRPFPGISGPQSIATHHPPQVASYTAFAGITDDLSRCFSTFKLDSSAALSLHSLPPFWISFLGSILPHSPRFPTPLPTLPRSSLLPYPPLYCLYVLEFLKAGSQSHFSSNSVFPSCSHPLPMLQKTSSGWWFQNLNPQPRHPHGAPDPKIQSRDVPSSRLYFDYF